MLKLLDAVCLVVGDREKPAECIASVTPAPACDFAPPDMGFECGWALEDAKHTRIGTQDVEPPADKLVRHPVDIGIGIPEAVGCGVVEPGRVSTLARTRPREPRAASAGPQRTLETNLGGSGGLAEPKVTLRM